MDKELDKGKEEEGTRTRRDDTLPEAAGGEVARKTPPELLPGSNGGQVTGPPIPDDAPLSIPTSLTRLKSI